MDGKTCERVSERVWGEFGERGEEEILAVLEERSLDECVKFRPTGRSDKAFCSSGNSASKAAVKPERIKRISPPSCE